MQRASKSTLNNKDMKTLLGFIAAASLFAATGTTGDPMTQLLWWSGCITVFVTTCKIYEKKYLTDEEKEERV